MGIAISAGVDLAAILGRLNDTCERLDSHLSRLERPGKWGLTNPVISPMVKKLSAGKTAAVSALTYTFIDCNPYGVPKGYIWDVRRLAVSGNDPFAVISGAAAFPYIAEVAPFDSNTEPPNFPDLIDIATTTIPNLSFWSTGQVMLTQGEHLILCLKSLPNSQQINVSYELLEFMESDLAVWASR